LRSEPNWVELDDLVSINERAVVASDEPHVVLSDDLLSAAVMSPRNHWHYEEVDDVAALAVRLCIAVARAHAFIQGNKRTGFIGSTQFLLSNGFFLDVPDVEEIAELIEDVIEYSKDEVELVAVYDQYLISTI
jgi:death-on-curing protein